jgi:CRISPR/Cas system-associated protein Cas10 (large subunit of type III CRISPR-Cas system)
MDAKQTGGGLKFAQISDAMERKNLSFFHSYFQTSSRRPKEVIRESGLQELRRLFNPEKTCRHRYFCAWCAKGEHVAKQPCHARNETQGACSRGISGSLG